MNSSGLTRPIRQGLPALALALLAGCAHPPPAQTAAPAAAVAKQAAGGGLLAVRVIAMPSPPRMLALALVTEDQPDPVWLQGRLQQGVPGLQADYLFAVPAARWRLRAVADAGDDDSAPLATLDLPLPLDGAVEPTYVGRLVLRWQAGTVTDIALEDRFDDDTLAFRVAVPQLRSVQVRNSALPKAGLLAPVRLPLEADGPSLQAAAAQAEHAQELPPKARQAWMRYLGQPMPRAFALSPQGAVGIGSGSDAVAHALRECTRRAGNQRCRLFSVDQTRVGMATDTTTTPR